MPETLASMGGKRFLYHDYAEGLPLCREEAPDVLLLDPPRKSCDRAVLDAAIQSGVPRIVYVSCDQPLLGSRSEAIASAMYKGWICFAKLPMWKQFVISFDRRIATHMKVIAHIHTVP
ncbi:MAG: hypothetical protein ACLUVV_02685 [Christensenellales bacterium]